uniref:SCO2400 family protein n=1 Tax=Streptomyces niveiscabiei TaxID=164115 RepID=UPI0006EB9648
MDYCHSCRRHLNGALACPGCGASAASLRAYPEGYGEQGGAAQEPYGVIPEAYGYEPAPEPVTEPVTEPVAAESPASTTGMTPPAEGGRAARRRGRTVPPESQSDDTGATDDDSATDDDADGEDGHPASGASRRDRKASAHRRRRRRAALIAAGVILLTAGVGLAELGMDAPGSSSGNPAAAGGEFAEVDGAFPTPGNPARALDDPSSPAK